MAKRTEKRLEKASTKVYSVRLTDETVARANALAAKHAHLGVRRAAILQLAIDRGLDVLEREHK